MSRPARRPRDRTPATGRATPKPAGKTAKPRTAATAKNKPGSASAPPRKPAAKKPGPKTSGRPKGTRPARTDRGQRKGASRRRRLLRAGLITGAVLVLGGFAYVLARVTLTPLPGSAGQVTGNTSPGESLRFYLDRPSVKAAALQVGGNLLLMSPLGVLLPVISDRLAGWLRVGLLTGLISLAVEVMQGTLIVGRSFDADDVLLNTAGAVLGYLVLGRRLRRYARTGRAARGRT